MLWDSAPGLEGRKHLLAGVQAWGVTGVIGAAALGAGCGLVRRQLGGDPVPWLGCGTEGCGRRGAGFMEPEAIQKP